MLKDVANLVWVGSLSYNGCVGVVFMCLYFKVKVAYMILLAPLTTYYITSDTSGISEVLVMFLSTVSFTLQCGGTCSRCPLFQDLRWGTPWWTSTGRFFPSQHGCWCAQLNERRCCCDPPLNAFAHGSHT